METTPKAASIPLKASDHKGNLTRTQLYSLVALLSALILGLSAYIIFIKIKRECDVCQDQKSQVTSTVDTPSDNTSTEETQNDGNPTDSFDDQSNYYIHSNGKWLIRYPRFNKMHASCEGKMNNSDLIKVPINVYEVPGESSFYLSAEIAVIVRHVFTKEGTIETDWATCTVVPTSLDLLMNGYKDEGLPPGSSNLWPYSNIRINYNSIENENDLNTLAQSMYQGCYAGSKELISSNPTVYQVDLVNKNGEKSHYPPEPNDTCFINSSFIFQYSPENRSAIISSGYQDPIFNGSNGQWKPEIVFY